MHAQIRTKPVKSPADLAAFLEVLANAGFNLESAGGSDLEHGGEFAFGLKHPPGDEREYNRAMQVLTDAGYHPRMVHVKHATIPHAPGALFELVNGLKAENLQAGLAIRDIATGARIGDDIEVQIFSEEAPLDP